MTTRIQIPGLPGYYQETTARYVYAHPASPCPICGSVGFLWQGWFTCDGPCRAVAILADGRVFVPVGP